MSGGAAGGGNPAASWMWRERGVQPKRLPHHSRVLREAAEDNLVRKPILTERHCEVPGVPRSTFLMVFSPDGTKVASTHGNHNVYVSELSTGKHVKTLSGHPRTPWCIAFHPSHTQLLASGCLGGQVRVWDLSGGSEVWTVGTESVVASIAFHPREQLLVIAAYNEIHFWDWSQPCPFTSIQTSSIKARVRFVAFDALGHKLITGISCWSYPIPPSSIVQPVPYLPPENPSANSSGNSSHEQIVSSYQHLVQRYNSLVRNYHYVIMGRSQITNTTDRGTDPMEADLSSNLNATDDRPSTEPTIDVQVSYHNRDDNVASADNIPSTSTASTESAQHGTSYNLNLNDQSSQLRDPPEPIPSTSRSAFQPLSYKQTPTGIQESRNTPSSSLPSSHSALPRTSSPRSGYPNQAIRNELTASLNRLQGFMENSIDRTLNLWERYDTARSINNLRDISSLRSVGRDDYYLNPENQATSYDHEDSNSSTDTLHPTSTPQNEPERMDVSIDPPNANEDASQNSESSNENSDAQRLDAIHNILRFSGNRLLNFITDMRNGRQPDDTDNTVAPESLSNSGDTTGPLSNENNELNQVNSTNGRNQTMDNSINTMDADNITNLRNQERNSNIDESLSSIPTRCSQNTSSQVTPSIDNIRENRNASNNNSGTNSGRRQSSRRHTNEAASSAILAETQNEARNNDAFDRVTRGVEAIERHTEALLNLSTRDLPTLRRVRGMWEDLRREIICLQRSSDQEAGSYFTLPPLDRFRLVNSNRTTSSSVNRPSCSHTHNSNSQSSSNNSSSARTSSRGRNMSSQLDLMISKTMRSLSNLQTWLERNSSNNSLPREAEPSMSSRNTNDNNSRQPTMSNNSESTAHVENPSGASNESHRSRASLPSRRNRSNRPSTSRLRSIRLQEIGHRRNVMNIRRGELEVTRDRIRMRARRVLAIMFSIMMDCLEADQLSNRIIAMLRSLKKALNVTSLLLVAHLFSDEPSRTHTQRNSAPASAQPNVTAERSVSSPENGNNSNYRFIQMESPSPNRNLLSSRLQQHSNEMYIQIRRSRTLFRLHPMPRLRRRVPLLSRTAHSVLNHSPTQNTSNDNASPSTSGMQQNATASNSNQNTNDLSSNVRVRQPPDTMRHMFRRLFLRRFVGNMLHVFQHSEIPELQNSADWEMSNQDAEHPRRYFLRDIESRREYSNDDQHSNSTQSLPVPLVHINDVPLNEMGQNPENLIQNPPPPYVRGGEYIPLGNAPNILAVENDNDNRWSTTFRFITECPSSPVHRIQVWDFTKGQMPDISNGNDNIVVRKCKIHNDACIDISKDGRLLVALLPAQRMGNMTHLLGIFSLEWHNLGECLYTTLLEQNAVSVSLSPCARHLAVGLGSRRVSLVLPVGRNGVMAMIYRLGSVKVKEKDSRLGSLIPVRSLEQNWDSGFTSLNCLRWAPQPGQGLVYANNTGQLKILS